MKRHNIEKCRTLRRNQTDAEKKLWAELRNRKLRGVKFRRQFPLGGYILDFYSPDYNLCIEADGGQHYEDRGSRHDEARMKDLAVSGLRILRFSNIEVLNNIEGVCEAILIAIEEGKQRPLTSVLSPKGRGRKTEQSNKILSTPELRGKGLP